MAAAESARSAAPTSAFHTCTGSRYMHAALGWGHKCLAAGHCKRSADREYHRYRFHRHTQDSRGSYQLTR